MIHKSAAREGWLEKAWRAADMALDSSPRKARVQAEIMRQCIEAAQMLVRDELLRERTR